MLTTPYLWYSQTSGGPASFYSDDILVYLYCSKIGVRDLHCSGQQQAEREILEEHFVRYDDQFEYGSHMPAVFLR